MRISFYHIQIDVYTKDSILKAIADDLVGNTAKSLFFINAHCFNTAYKNQLYKTAIHQSDYILNDGIGIKIAGIINKTKFVENLNGTDLIPQIIQLSLKKQKSIFLLGSTDKVLTQAQQNIETKYLGTTIAGTHNGFFNLSEEANIIEQINNSGAQVLIVGMGVPLQELFINRNLHKFTNIKLCIAGGAIIDFISGKINRAPIFMQKINLEWLYRLCIEPKRMWRRYLLGNVLFFIYLFKIKLLR